MYICVFHERPPKRLLEAIRKNGGETKIFSGEEKKELSVSTALIQMSGDVISSLKRPISDLLIRPGLGCREKRCLKALSGGKNILLAGLVSRETKRLFRPNMFGFKTIKKIRYVLRRDFGLDFWEFSSNDVRKLAKEIAARD